MLWKCCTQYASKIGKLSSGHRTGNCQFHSKSKKGNAKECSNYCTIVLISHASKVMLKILQGRLQQYVNHELPDVQAGYRKAVEPDIKLPASTGSLKKQENSRKKKTKKPHNPSTSASLTTPKTLTVWITTNCGKIFKEMGIPGYLTCLLRNPCAGQDATVGTGHGTTDWFQIGKGVRQDCILSTLLI